MSAAEFVVPPESWITRGRSADLAGRRIGETTVEALEESTRLGHIWRCRCDCGQAFMRSTAQLFRAKRDNITVACPDCVRELLSGRTLSRNTMNVDAFLGLWADHGTLWSAGATERLERRVRDDLEEAFGLLVPHVSEQDRRSSHELVDITHPHPRSRQQAAYLYPIGDDEGEREWRCVDCGSFGARVFGCVRCVEPVCVACVAAEKHVSCSDAGIAANKSVARRAEDEDEEPETIDVLGATLGRIGSAIGRSRERVRQIEYHAVMKLRRLPAMPLAPRTAWCGDDGPPAPWYWCQDHGWIRTIRYVEVSNVWSKWYEPRCGRDDCEQTPGAYPPQDRPPDILAAKRAVAASIGESARTRKTTAGRPAVGGAPEQIQSEASASISTAVTWWWCPACSWTRDVDIFDMSTGFCLRCKRQVSVSPDAGIQL